MRTRLPVSHVSIIDPDLEPSAMRRVIVVGLSLLVSAPAVGADGPIPQDKARMEQQFRDRLDWSRQTLEGAYDKVGKKDARWDKPAREAFDLAARMFSRQYEPVVRPSDVHVAAKKAVDAGCDDPLILYLFFRTSVDKQYPGEAEYDRRAQAAATAMAASTYPALRRATALFYTAQLKAWKKKPSDEQRREAERGLDAVIDLLKKSLAEDTRNDHWDELWYSTINQVIASFRQLSGDYKAAFDRVDAKLAQIPKIEALRLTVKGNFLFYWGWEARTTALAPFVGEDRFRTFHERLSGARAALEAAWKLNPGQPHVAALMIDIEKAIGEGDRQAMETWFDRAMSADGDDFGACFSKLDWLDPKWHGGDSWEALMDFGKACAATKNWHTGITLLAADAHLRYGGTLPHREKTMYFNSPEVWNDIHTVYDEYLRHYPDDNTQRSKYAMLCYMGKHYDEAHAQFQAVGDGLTQWTTFPYIPFEEMTQARDFTARVIANRRRRGNAPAPKDDGPP
jgi:hypothetical protein